MPSLPDVLFHAGTAAITKDIAIIVCFALIMITASVSMIWHGKRKSENPAVIPSFQYPMIILEGIVVGALTGIVEAGGGFLIIPALVLFAKLPMKTAIGTSLLIIAIKSLFGIIGDLQSNQPIVWSFLLIFTAVTIAGILLGSYLANFVDGKKLKTAFGYFVLLMGVYILLRELVFEI